MENNGNITGNWDSDKNILKLISYGIENKENITSQLIMGFGSSASGKTFWAKKLIKFISGDNIPYISIDGGIYRETSIIYQIILKVISKIDTFNGFANLIISNIQDKILSVGTNNLFESNNIKKTIYNFLNLTKEKKTLKDTLRLYIPETLSNCNKCSEKYYQINK